MNYNDDDEHMHAPPLIFCPPADRCRAQLRELRESKDGAGAGARADAQRLAAENTRLRRRQAELIGAFKKQVMMAVGSGRMAVGSGRVAVGSARPGLGSGADARSCVF